MRTYSRYILIGFEEDIDRVGNTIPQSMACPDNSQDYSQFSIVLFLSYLFLQVVQLILQGILLRAPESCPPEVREVMRLCWSSEASDRLDFPEIHSRLSQAKKNLEIEDDLEQLEHLNYTNLSHVIPSPPQKDLFTKSDSKLPMDRDEYLLPTPTFPETNAYLTILDT